jgi:hypothetical protein
LFEVRKLLLRVLGELRDLGVVAIRAGARADRETRLRQDECLRLA